MPDIEGVDVSGRNRHRLVALPSNFIIHMLKSLHQQNLTIWSEFEKQ